MEIEGIPELLRLNNFIFFALGTVWVILFGFILAFGSIGWKLLNGH
jgi:hypothetical protein